MRIMELGDSITAGVGANGIGGDGGYRRRLAALLSSAGYRVTFVGRRTDFSPGLADPNHEGWPGYVIRELAPGAPGQLYGPLTEEAIRRNDPDVILLMVGTNDLLRYRGQDGTFSDSEIVHSMDLLLGEIFRTKPTVRVVLGGIIDSPRIDACAVKRFDDGRSSCDEHEYPNLRDLAASYARRGNAITYADMIHVVPRSKIYFPDGIHPAGSTGYDLVANAWFSAIRTITQPEGGQAISAADPR